MKTYKINGTNYQVPTSWEDIRLERFKQMKALERRADSMDELEYNMQYISIISGVPEDDLMTLDSDSLKDIMVDIYSFAQKELPVLLDVIFEHDGKKYVLNKDMDKTILGQYIDIDNLLKNTDDCWDVAEHIVGSLVREAKPILFNKVKNIFNKKPSTFEDYKINKYSNEEMKANAVIFKEHMPMSLVNSVMVFFLTTRNNLNHFIQIYSQHQEQTQKIKTKRRNTKQ